MKNVANSIYVSPTDKWAVVMKNQPETSGVQALPAFSTFIKIVAPETLGADYKKLNGDWKNLAGFGNGAFILKDYVGASAATFVSNPNYWRHDPFFPENQLPYVDVFKLLIVPDLSTRLAGLRTGKIDNLYPLKAEDAESLTKTNPELEWVSYITYSPPSIHPRNDTKPFNDVRVRRALNMAIDKRELQDVYYEGKAEFFTFPIPPIVENMDLYIPLEELPESVQELYTYNPEKARQLLAEAGYPDGFKTEILTIADDVDLLSIIKEYWAKIGVDLKLDIRESAIYATVYARRTYTQMVMRNTMLVAYILSDVRVGGVQNGAMVNDPEVEELYKAIQANYFDRAKGIELYKNPTKTRPNWVTYFHEQAYYIPLPSPYLYVMWQPWLKNYGGAINATWWGGYTHPQYVWIDQELKGAMGR